MMAEGDNGSDNEEGHRSGARGLGVEPPVSGGSANPRGHTARA